MQQILFGTYLRPGEPFFGSYLRPGEPFFGTYLRPGEPFFRSYPEAWRTLLWVLPEACRTLWENIDGTQISSIRLQAATKSLLYLRRQHQYADDALKKHLPLLPFARLIILKNSQLNVRRPHHSHIRLRHRPPHCQSCHISQWRTGRAASPGEFRSGPKRRKATWE